MSLHDVPASFVQAAPPADGGARRRVYVLALEQVHPVIRIAHRRREARGLRLGERIIFDHELVLIERGRGRLLTGAGATAFDAGTLLLIQPFVPHRFEPEPGEESVHVAVHFDLAPRIPGHDDHPPERRAYEVRFPRGRRLPPTIRAEPHGQLARHVADIVSLRDANSALDRAEAQSRLLAVLLTMLRHSPEPVATGQDLDERTVARLERAVTWIETNLHRDIGVADVADVAEFSPSHLTRLFTQWTGDSPKAFIRRARIERARRLLANVDLSIKQVAMQTGFKNPYHFSKAFRQVDGLSPSRYREALGIG